MAVEKKDVVKLVVDLAVDTGTHLIVGGLAGLALSTKAGLALKVGKVLVPMTAWVYGNMLSHKGCKYANDTIDEIDKTWQECKNAMTTVKKAVEDSTED